MVKLSIIILTYNSSEYIPNCLSSLLFYYKKQLREEEFEIVVSDNASVDSTLKKVIEFTAKEKIKINLIKNKENLGFAKGINNATRRSRGEYLLLLNPDAEVVDNGIDKMVGFMERNGEIGIVGGKILDENGEKELNCGNFYGLKNTIFLSLGLENLLGIRFSSDKGKQVDFVSGGFMMIRKKVFEKLSGFDENYFMYVEDMDFCFRAKKQGFKTFFFPYVTIKHYKHGSGSEGFAIVNIYKGLRYFYKKHKSKAEYGILNSLLLSKARVAIVLGFAFGKKDLVKAYKEAINENN